MDLYFDIETIPSQRDDIKPRLADKIKEPNITKAGKIKSQHDLDAWRETEKPLLIEPEYLKTSLDSAYGEIVSIAWALGDGPVECVYRDLDGDEAMVLSDFFNRVKTKSGPNRVTRWVGHYITGFDLRYLWHRCIINRVNPPIRIPYDAKPWDSIVYDTMVEWSGLKDRISQDDLCFALGIPGKPTDIDGSKVWDYVKSGRINDVVEYNKDDVEKVRLIYKVMNFIETKDESLGYDLL